MVYYGYTRLSQESDTSIEDQKNDIDGYSDERDLELKKIFDEGQGTSGFNDDREQYQAMKDMLDITDAEGVIVRDRARLGRNFDERMRFVLDLRERDLELHVTQEGKVPLDDAFDVVKETMHSASDDKKKREEIKKAKKAIERKKERGEPLGTPPKGLKYSKDKTEFVPSDEFDSVVRAIKLREEEDKSYTEINEETGIPVGTISRILDRKEVYLEKQS